MGGGRRKWVRGQCLGSGSTATVYLATSTTSGDRQSYFAVKSAELSHSAPLQREQKILSSLCSPHVVSFFGSDVTAEPDGRVLYNLFMEYVAGGSLADAIKHRGGLDGHTIRLYTRGILDGLEYLHSSGIVHCDVKGRNILVGKDDRSVKLADLGCARLVDGSGDGRGVISGTPLYMAPEVARGEEQGPSADIWALGCTVIEMVTGCPGWRDVEDPVATIHRIAFSTDVPEIPCNLSDDARDFLGRCLSRDPGRRWSAGQLLRHPFVKCCEEFAADSTSVSKRNSPKSTLDQGFWDSWQDEEEDDAGRLHLGDEQLPLRFVQERLLPLVGGALSPPPAANATWEESCWVTIRNGVSSGGQQTSSSGSCGVQEPVGGTVGDEKFDCCGYYCSTASSSMWGAFPPGSSDLSCCNANDDINHSCVGPLLDGRNNLKCCNYFIKHERLREGCDYDISDVCQLLQENYWRSVP